MSSNYFYTLSCMLLFHPQLFMLNIDSILCTLEENENDEVEKLGGSGCTTILCNKDEVTQNCLLNELIVIQ